MTKSQKTQPELRFSGFNDDWEQRSLNTLAEFNPKSNLPEIFEYVDLESVVGTELVGHRTENRDSAPSRAQRLAKKDDVFYQTVRPYQKNNYLFDLPYDNYVFSTGYAQMRPIGNGYFLLTLVQEDKFVNRVLERSTGTSYPAINSNVLAKLSIKVPADIEEQQQVGTLFKQLDDTLALHQRKLEQLKLMKKGFLQQLFPKNGEKVPKVRFANFEGDWEQRKLGDIVNSQIKGKAQFEKLNHGTVEYLDASRLNGGEPILTNAFKDVLNNDILILWDGSKAGTVYTGFEGALGSTLKAYRTSADNNFIYQFLKHNQENIYKNYRTPNIPHVQKNFLEIFKIMMTNKEEQTRIGNFFFNLEREITLHQQKIEQLKAIKKGLLQKMFI